MNDRSNRSDTSTTTGDWQELTPGEEYKFYFLYVGLDDQQRLRKLIPTHRYAALLKFDNYLRRYVIEANGRFWIWKGKFRGVILFPFDPDSERCVSCAFKIMFNKRFFDIEESLLKEHISFRIAMHAGTTAYYEQPEGKVLPYKSINTVFHLGDKYVQPGTFCLTKDIYETIPEHLKPFFAEEGKFEDNTIYKMRKYY